MDNIRQNRVNVTFSNEQGDKVVRMINTTMSPEEVKRFLPLEPAFIERRLKSK